LLVIRRSPARRCAGKAGNGLEYSKISRRKQRAACRPLSRMARSGGNGRFLPGGAPLRALFSGGVKKNQKKLKKVLTRKKEALSFATLQPNENNSCYHERGASER
jgi:hypothetical protein